jgi:benzoyl-CoA reductase subunit B
MSTDGNSSSRRLKSVDAVRAYQRAWLEDARNAAQNGAPFAISNSDESEEIFTALGIPVLVINYWNFIIVSQGKAKHYSDLLEARGFPGPHFFGLGLASTLDPENAPWGGLPKPAVLVGSTRSESELRVTEMWARELKCPFFPLDFNFASGAKRIPPKRWWERIRDDWENLVDPDRLDLRVQQNKELIRYLETITGRTFSLLQLSQVMERVNQQMDQWTAVSDLIAEAPVCPVSLRDQLAMYQTMWHRGSEKALEFINAYYQEVKERVNSGINAYGTTKYRLLYWSMLQEPPFHAFLQERYQAAFVACDYSSTPQFYARTVHNNDPLRALSARHLFLFLHTPEWAVWTARRFHCDGVIAIEPPSRVASANQIACENAGIPFLAVPGVKDDEQTRAALSTFIEHRLDATQK